MSKRQTQAELVDTLRNGLESLCRDLACEIEEMQTGRLTAFKATLAHARWLSEAAKATKEEV